MLKCYSSLLVRLIASCLCILHAGLANAGDTTTSNLELNLKHKPLFITCCDFGGSGLKDIVVADEHQITVFKQTQNQSFESLTVHSTDKILAINPIRFSKNMQESLLCFTNNSLFYYSMGDDGHLKEPVHIPLPDAITPFLDKNQTLNNFSFVTDINSDGLDDIVIPSRAGIFILLQKTNSFFTPHFVNFASGLSDNSLTIAPWPKTESSSNKECVGVYFFPTESTIQTYWLQDYNNDALLDIIALTPQQNGYEINIYLQQNDCIFINKENIVCQGSMQNKRSHENTRLIDVNNDEFLDIVESNIEYPLQGNTSLLPIISHKIYIARSEFQFSSSPTHMFKTTFIPGLDSITDLDSDGKYEIVSFVPPLKLGSKESILDIATKKEIDLKLTCSSIKEHGFGKDMGLNKILRMRIPALSDIDTSQRFVRLEDITGDGMLDILVLKENTLMEIILLNSDSELLSVNQILDVAIPYYAAEIAPIDINSDGKKELLIPEKFDNKIHVIFLKC